MAKMKSKIRCGPPGPLRLGEPVLVLLGDFFLGRLAPFLVMGDETGAIDFVLRLKVRDKDEENDGGNAKGEHGDNERN